MTIATLCKKHQGQGHFIIYYKLKQNRSYLLSYDSVAECCIEVPVIWDPNRVNRIAREELNYLYEVEDTFHFYLNGKQMTQEEAVWHKELQSKIEFLSSYKAV